MTEPNPEDGQGQGGPAEQYPDWYMANPEFPVAPPQGPASSGERPRVPLAQPSPRS